MNKKWLYAIISVFFLISLFYDKQIVLTIVQNRINLLDGFMVWLTNLLTIMVIFLLMTTLFLWEERKREWILPLWATVLATTVVITIIKIIMSRPRPFEVLTFPLVKGANYAFSVWNSSFPSLHTAVVFALVPILDKEFPKLKWFWIILASLIAFSRLYIGVHYLSDILFGLLVGLVVGYGIIRIETKHSLFKKWKKKKN